ncbi:MAG TPA: porin [Rhodocyclaceae bacterium]|nr:porin [Rhodocyclaceae bacterium]
MQKKLIALAVATLAAGSAFAQSNVTISGFISSGYAITSYAGGNGVRPAGTLTIPGTPGPAIDISNKLPFAAGAKTNGREQGVIDSRLSRIRFAGTEDLGNGLKAEFQVESRFMSDTSDPTAGLGALGVGDTFVGLNGNWGRLRLGRMDTYYADGILIEMLGGTASQSFATLSLLTQVDSLSYHATAGRWNNQVRYDTPRINGFAGTVAYSSNRAAEDGAAANNADQGGAWYASANYFAGAVYAGISAQQHSTEGATDNKSSGWRTYGSYTFPVGIKIGLSYDHGRQGAAGGAWLKRNAWFVPVSYKFGNNTVLGSYGRAGQTKRNTGSIDDSGARFYNLSYNYELSRRTNIGVNYTVLKNKDNSAYDLLLGGVVKGAGQTQPTSYGQSVKQFAVSIAHTF